jgi:hypothetical protein
MSGCAAEARLTIVHHALHVRGAHRVLRGPHAGALDGAGAGWPEALAALMGGAAGGATSVPDYPGTLVSWIIT